MVATTRVQTGRYTVTADRDLTGCVPTATTFSDSNTATACTFLNDVYVAVTDSSSEPTISYVQVVVTC